MKKNHIATKTHAQLDRLYAFISAEMPFNPSTRKMAAHLGCSQNQVLNYIRHLKNQGRIIVHPETGQVAIQHNDIAENYPSRIPFTSEPKREPLLKELHEKYLTTIEVGKEPDPNHGVVMVDPEKVRFR